jgi:hypothetical protein
MITSIVYDGEVKKQMTITVQVSATSQYTITRALNILKNRRPSGVSLRSIQGGWEDPYMVEIL